MAAVATLILRGRPLNGMGRGELPGRQHAEVGKRVFEIEIEQAVVDRNVTDDRICLGPLVGLARVQSDLKPYLRRLGLKVRQFEYVLRHVAAVTVFIRHRVAHLTADFLLMQNVLWRVGGACLVNRVVTAHASRPVRYGIAVFVLNTIAVHLIGGMAGFAPHIFCPMNIGGNSFIQTEKLFFHPAAVTCGAGLLYRWSFLDIVTGKQSAAHTCRATDVALAAAGVTGATVGLSRHIHGIELLYVRQDVPSGPHLNHSFVGLESGVQTRLKPCGDLAMTQTTGPIEIVPGRISVHTIVGCTKVTVIRIAAVAEDAFQATMDRIVREPFIIYKYRFVRSQRLHIAASALANGLGGLNNLVPKLEGDLPSGSNERACAGMATDAPASALSANI